MIDLQSRINVFSNKNSAGIAAGKAVENCIVQLLESQDEVRIIFAAAPSQSSMLDYLANSTRINWRKIVAFHMDEYVGLPKDSEQLFSKFLGKMLFSKVQIKKVDVINPHNIIDEELERYSQIINEADIDIVCLGIGENGHIAFNDPPVADFNDKEIIKLVELDEDCRTQQVNDKCFEKIDDVPRQALTLTIPTLMKGKHLFCVVSGPNKSTAIKKTFEGPLSTSCPASILTTHLNCRFFLDDEAFKDVSSKKLITRKKLSV